jgi:hypothetical protein
MAELHWVIPGAPISSGGRTMTEPTDIGKSLAVTSRRRFLHESGALVGGAVVAGDLAGSEALAATKNAENQPPGVPEWMKTPGDPREASFTGCLRHSKRTSSKTSQRTCRNICRHPGGRHCRISTASSHRTDCFMNAIMAGSHRRSSATSADAPWPRGQAADLYHGRPQALSF